MKKSLLDAGIIKLTDKEFGLIANLVYDKFGINLTEKKKTLVVGRLNKLIKKLGFSNFNDYYNFVINDNTNVALLTLIDKISTNHTFFFREKTHFDFLKKIALPEIVEKLKAQGSNDLRIWCAGCATGEEAYTIAMVVNDFFMYDIKNWDIGILATDISTTALTVANQGIYPKDRIKDVSVSNKHKYFKIRDEETVVVNEELKKHILFKRLNFMNESFPFKRKFHVIFCRNVMIYFDNPTKTSLVNKFYNYTYDDGYLFVGHSESLDRRITPFSYIKPATYKKCIAV